MGRLRSIFKVDTDDMIANVGTKFESDGTLPSMDVLRDVFLKNEFAIRNIRYTFFPA